MPSHSHRSPPPPPLDLISVAPATSFVFTSSHYQTSSTNSHHSRHASLSSKMRKEHAHGAFGARTTPETLLPPGFVQLASNTIDTTVTMAQASGSDPVPSSSRPLWLPRYNNGAHQPPPSNMLSTTSESPIHDPDSYFPPLYTLDPGTSTGNTSPICSTASSPVQSLSQTRFPPSPRSPRRTMGGAAHELSLTELMNGTNVFGSSVDARDRAGPRYQTMPRPPRPSPKPRSKSKSKDKLQLDRLGKRVKLYSSDATVVSNLDPIDNLKSELQRLSVTTDSVPEAAFPGMDTEKSGKRTEPDVATRPLPL